MPINFSDLVSKVEQQNAINRQQLVAQVMPAIDLMVKRREVDYDKEQFAQGLRQLAETEGITDFNVDPTMSKDMMQATYSQLSSKRKTENAAKAFYDATGTTLPSDWDKLTPEAKAVRAKRDEMDYSTVQAINAVAEANPDIKPILEKNKDKPVATQEALVKKYLADKGKAEEWEEWKKKANYSAALAMQESDNAAANKPEKTATPTQINTVTKRIDDLNQEANLFATKGNTYILGDKKVTVKAGKDTNGTLTVTMRDNKGRAISYDGTSFRGKKVTKRQKEALRSAMADLKTLKMKQSSAVDAYNRVVGAQPQPEEQPNNTSQLKQMDKTVQSLIGKY